MGGVCRQLTERVAQDERGELALRMYLQSALVLDQMPFPKHQELAYEFFSQVRQHNYNTDKQETQTESFQQELWPLMVSSNPIFKEC